MAHTRKGFTIIELVLFAAIFSITAVSFVTILLATTRIQLRQGSAAEVNSQSQFLLQTLQRYVEQASVIEMPANNASTTLTLRMASSTYDPTKIYLSSGRIYIQEGSLGAQPITSDKVTASNVQFMRRENIGGHDSVSISFTLAYNSANSQNVFTQSLQTSVARVSAATFDSNVIPNTGNTWKLGISAGDWQSINNTIFFNGSNVGIGTSNPSSSLQIVGTTTASAYNVSTAWSSVSSANGWTSSMSCRRVGSFLQIKGYMVASTTFNGWGVNTAITLPAECRTAFTLTYPEGSCWTGSTKGHCMFTLDTAGVFTLYTSATNIQNFSPAGTFPAD